MTDKASRFVAIVALNSIVQGGCRLYFKTFGYVFFLKGHGSPTIGANMEAAALHDRKDA